jgi:hypothetical protein
MNSGFSPVVVNPSGFKVQRQSQQMPFHFGGSQVPIHMMTGGGMPREAVPFKQQGRPVMSIRPIRKPPPHLAKMSGSGGAASIEDKKLDYELKILEDRIAFMLEVLLKNSKIRGYEDNGEKYDRIRNRFMAFNRVASNQGMSKKERKERLKDIIDFAESIA